MAKNNSYVCLDQMVIIDRLPSQMQGMYRRMMIKKGIMKYFYDFWRVVVRTGL